MRLACLYAAERHYHPSKGWSRGPTFWLNPAHVLFVTKEAEGICCAIHLQNAPMIYAFGTIDEVVAEIGEAMR